MPEVPEGEGVCVGERGGRGGNWSQINMRIDKVLSQTVQTLWGGRQNIKLVSTFPKWFVANNKKLVFEKL